MPEELEETANTEQTPQEETSNSSTPNQSDSQSADVSAENSTPTDDLSVLKKELDEQKDKYLRLFAEFDNFKKRNAKERLELFKTAGQDIMRELLPVLDDFQRAENAFAKDNNLESYATGIKLIQDKLFKSLQNKGLKSIESIGKEFDVAQHEAVAEIPAPSEELKGKILDEVQCGYTLNDTIIRYAKVVVGK